MMENVLLRFPHLGEAIFQKVDNMSLASCQTVNGSWHRFIQYQKRPKWIRIKHRQVKNLETLSKELNGVPVYDGSQINGLFVRMFFSSIRNTCMFPGGYTLLHLAAINGYLGICELIIKKLDKSGKQNPSNEWGDTPLHCAARYGHLDVYQLINQNVNEKNPANGVGNTPLHYAAENGYLKICQMIIQTSSPKNPQNNLGFTPLHFAARCGKASICELIMNNVGDKNPKTLDGSTPLHEAAKAKQSHQDHLNVCKVLVENGADKNSMDQKGRTPIAYAYYQNNENSPLFQYLSSLLL